MFVCALAYVCMCMYVSVKYEVINHILIRDKMRNIPTSVNLSYVVILHTHYTHLGV